MTPSRREFLKASAASAALALPMGGVANTFASPVVSARPWHADLARQIRDARDGLVKPTAVPFTPVRDGIALPLFGPFKVEIHGRSEFAYRTGIEMVNRVNGSEFCGAPPGTLRFDSFAVDETCYHAGEWVDGWYEPTAFSKERVVRYAFMLAPRGWNRAFDSHEGRWKAVEFADGQLLYPPADFGLLP